MQEETAIYSQHRTFRLLHDELVQKGPSFPHPKDVSIDARSGQVKVRYTDDEGKEQVEFKHIDLPADPANGIVFSLLKNVPQSAVTKVSMIVTTPKPRLVKLAISSQGEDSFLVGGIKRRATRYVVKIELGGITGVVAPLLGKEPKDIQVWILGGEAPAFVKSTGPLYSEGPTWSIELECPGWPDRTGTN